MTVDVVIPTFGQWELTASCLSHLAQQTVPHTVIVVDNGSTDGTPDKIRAAFPDVRVIELGTNLGFTVACNRGAASGNGEIIVLINNDVEVRPDFLETLVRPFAEDARLGSAAALLVRPGGNAIDSIGLTADRTLAGFPRLRGRPVSEAASQSPVLIGPTGGGGAYRREAWEEVRGFDEGVLFYGEDLDLAIQIRAAGWDAIGVDRAVGVHLGSATFGHRSAWQRYQAGFSRGYFLRRYGVLRSAVAARLLVTEAIVVTGDALLGRDVSALRGRLAGWRAAKGLPASPRPPRAALDGTIGLLASLRLRRQSYAG